MSLHHPFLDAGTELAKPLFVDEVLAGFLVAHERAFRFHAANAAFALLDGSRFVSRERAEQAASRLKRAMEQRPRPRA